MSLSTIAFERKILLISVIASFVIGCTALLFAWHSGSKAIMLDGLFNITYFLAGLFTLKVARQVHGGDDERFPYGYSFFESLINGIKGILILGVSIVAFIDAVDAILHGGRVIDATSAIIYGSFATISCWTIAIITQRGATQSISPLVKADADNWYVNGAISSAVLIAFAGITFINDTQFSFLMPYVDPALVIIVMLLSISIPIRIAWQALMELLNRTVSSDIIEHVEEAIRRNMSSLPVQELFVRVIQPGRSRMVLAHAVLPMNCVVEIATLDTVRSNTLEELSSDGVIYYLDIVFTADRQWGAPINTGKQL